MFARVAGLTVLYLMFVCVCVCVTSASDLEVAWCNCTTICGRSQRVAGHIGTACPGSDHSRHCGPGACVCSRVAEGSLVCADRATRAAARHSVPAGCGLATDCSGRAKACGNRLACPCPSSNTDPCQCALRPSGRGPTSSPQNLACTDPCQCAFRPSGRGAGAALGRRGGSRAPTARQPID